MTDRDPNSAKRTTLKEKLASLDPARREKIEAETKKMHDDLRQREAIFDKLVEDAQANDMGYERS
jgi:ABC-type Zn2+ transport system substrate-binding protein/surface adhesin